jgi:hypothetical protein
MVGPFGDGIANAGDIVPRGIGGPPCALSRASAARETPSRAVSAARDTVSGMPQSRWLPTSCWLLYAPARKYPCSERPPSPELPLRSEFRGRVPDLVDRLASQSVRIPIHLRCQAADKSGNLRRVILQVVGRPPGRSSHIPKHVRAPTDLTIEQLLCLPRHC